MPAPPSLDAARTALLTLVAEAIEFSETPDQYVFQTDHATLRALCDAVGIPVAANETPGDALLRAITEANPPPYLGARP